MYPWCICTTDRILIVIRILLFRRTQHLLFLPTHEVKAADLISCRRLTADHDDNNRLGSCSMFRLDRRRVDDVYVKSLVPPKRDRISGAPGAVALLAVPYREYDDLRFIQSAGKFHREPLHLAIGVG